MSIGQLEFTPSDGATDSAPPLSDVEYPCEVCGKEAGPYKGKGRKPKLCEDHKRGATTKSATPIRTPGNTNAKLAAQAADALDQMNGLVAFVAAMAQWEHTGEAIQTGRPTFRDQAYEALLTDPELCRTILRGGVMSGRVALIMAYGMFGVSVAPVALMEARQKKLAREEIA